MKKRIENHKEKQKRLEAEVFEKFLNACPEYGFETWMAFDDLPETRTDGFSGPDLIADSQHGTIGIELSHVYQKNGTDPKALQNQLPLRKLLIHEANKIFMEKFGVCDRDVHFGFGRDGAIQGSRPRQKLAKELACFVQENIVNEEFGQLIWLDSELLEGCSVFISSKTYEDAKWQECSVHETPVMDFDVLKNKISQKNKKLRHYIPCDQHWLLLVIDFWDSAQDQQLPRAGWPALASTGFDKILIFKTVENECLELQQG